MSMNNRDGRSSPRAGGSGAKADKKRILVVDDEPSITRLLKLNLEQSGDYLVRTENGPVAALVAVEEFQPDLILLDVAMPGMDGGELARRIRETTPRVPIVFLTALATKEEVSKAEGVIGGLPFLAKPVNMQEVLSCLDKHLTA